MLLATAIAPDRSDEHKMLSDVDAVDLDDQDVEAGKIARHPLLQALSRQRHKLPRGSGFRQPGPDWRRHIALRQPHRSSEFAGRNIDQHLVHSPRAKPVFRDRSLPARQRQFLAAARTYPRPFNVNLAAVKADLATGAAPTITVPGRRAAMARTAGLLGILLHHRAQRLDPRSQAKALETGRDLLECFTHRIDRR